MHVHKNGTRILIGNTFKGENASRGHKKYRKWQNTLLLKEKFVLIIILIVQSSILMARYFQMLEFRWCFLWRIMILTEVAIMIRKTQWKILIWTMEQHLLQ